MGITKLANLIHFDAPKSLSKKEIGDYSGKIIALDTSIVVNQFRSALPGHLKLGSLTGLFYRTLVFLEHDIKPVFVFDGKPPEEKRAVLNKRSKITGQNNSQRPNTVPTFTQDCLRLLSLLGVPFVKAPGEAEAMCAHLAKRGVVNAVASEDMDTLAFGGTVLLCNLNAKKDSEITEYSLPKLLQSLQLTQEEFVDLCILLGCDYCGKIEGLGPRRALKLIREHRTIEAVMEHVNKKVHRIPQNWNYKAARRLFFETPHTERLELCWNEPDEEGLVHFLCTEKHLKEEKVRMRMKKFHEVLLKKRKQREIDEKMGPTRQTCLKEFFPVTRRRKAEDAATKGCSRRKQAKKLF